MSKITTNRSLISNKDPEVNFNSKTGVLTHYISTEDINCYNYILKNTGYDETEFRLNPQVLWQHQAGGALFGLSPMPKDLIVGTNLALRADDKGVEADTKFSDDELGQSIKEYNLNGLLNNWSVRWEFLNDEDQDLMMLGDVPVVLNWKIKEYSSCILSGNPKASNRLSYIDNTKKMLSMTTSPILQKTLAGDLISFELQSDIEEMKERYDTLNKELQEKQAPDYDKIKKELREEMKADIGRYKQEVNSKLLTFADKFFDLKGDLHSKLKNVLTDLPEVVDKQINKFVGKLPK